MVDVPALPTVTVTLLVPLREATEVLPLEKLTAREDVLVAARLKPAYPAILSAGVLKVMV